MGRRLLMGIGVLLGVVTWSAWPEAAPRNRAVTAAPLTVAYAPIVVGGMTFTNGFMNGEPTLLAEGRGVTFFKRVGSAKVTIRVEVPGDIVELEADAKGAVRVGRKGKFIRLQMTADYLASVAKVQKLMAGSAALDGLENLAASLGSSERIEARSVMTSYALLHAIRGSVAPTRELAGSLKAQTSAKAARASLEAREEMPYDCWVNYSITVNTYLYEFSDCVLNWGYIPGVSSVCAFEFTVKAELAWFWLIGCSGGLPAV